MNTLYPRKRAFWTPVRMRILFIILLFSCLAVALGILGAMEPIEFSTAYGV